MIGLLWNLSMANQIRFDFEVEGGLAREGRRKVNF